MPSLVTEGTVITVVKTEDWVSGKLAATLSVLPVSPQLIAMSIEALSR